MLDKVIHFSIRNKLLVFLGVAAMIIWGIWSMNRLSIDAVPDITNNQVQIITNCPTLAGQEVEQLVTYPIEQSIANLPDLVELRSISRFGLSVITAVFDDKVDIYFARQLINERLKEAESNIPPGIGTPELAPVSTGLGEVYQYIIHPDSGSENKYSAMDLRTMQDWIVARQLYGTPGIAEVNSFGGELKQYEVALNPDRLKSMDVTIAEVFAALEKNNENTGGAYIDKKPNAYFIRGIGLVTSLNDVRKILVKNNSNGIPILIKDVATVEFGYALRYGAMTYNGEVDAVGGVVMMLKGSNSARVVESIKAKMATIQKSLPDDIVIEPFLDRTDLVNRSIHTVKKNLIEGALIVIFVLVLFLGNFRAGLIVASAIPLSMLFALALMNVFGVSANLMSLGAIDFGLIVDGAVIIVEATMHHLALRQSIAKLSSEEMDQEVYQSASKIRSSAAFGEIIILIVYIPILTLIGIEGKMFRPMAQTVSFAIAGALLLSLTYIPAMCAVFLPKKIKPKKNLSDKMMDFFQWVYEPLLRLAVKLKYWVVGLTVAVFAFSIFIFSRMGGEFIPTLQEGDFAFHCILPQGTSLSQSVETSMQASRLVRTFPEVKMVVGKTGSAEVPTDPMPPEATDMMIILKPHEDWATGRTYDELADSIMEKLEVMPGVFFEKNQPIQMRFNELMTGIRQDVAVKIFGENMDSLLFYANKVAAVIQKVKGTTEPMVERVDGLPQITIEYNREQLANYGLNIQDINHIVSMAFAGQAAGVVFENERKFDLVVRLDSAHRQNMDDVKNLYVPLKNGSQIPLSQVAGVEMKIGPAQISREAGKRRIVIGFNVKGRDVQSVVTEIKEKLGSQVKLPTGYYFTYGGTFENLQKASDRLMVAVPVALALIFLLLYFTFRSLKQATLIFTAIPMAAIGGVFALQMRGMPFSISAGVGFIALFGVAVLNGIVLMGTFNQLKKDGITDVLQQVFEGTKIRLRPVLMTAAVASLGFFPMAISHGAGAEVQKPLATVVIGGLVSATFLTLFVLPLLYIIFNSHRKMKPTPAPSALVILIVCLLAGSANAQSHPIALTAEDAVSLALKNNLGLQADQLSVRAAGAMQKTAFVLPKMNLNWQHGQYNSINQDNAIQISQSIPFPTWFSRRAALFRAEHEGSELSLLESINEVRAQTKVYFYTLVYLNEQQKQMHQLDSLYSDFARAANVRYMAGETGLLEKTTAETKREEIRQRLKQNESEILTAWAALRAVMNTHENYFIPAGGSYLPLKMEAATDTALINSNPSLKLMYQNVIVANEHKRVEISQALPEFTVGYFNQSLIGFQTINGRDVYFGGNNRFTGINAGISVPLTIFSNGAAVKSLDLQKQSLQMQAENSRRILQAEAESIILEYEKNLAHYKYYQAQALPNAEAMISAAKIGYTSGEIGYMEYLISLQTATDVQLNYLSAIHQLNLSVVKFNYLINR
jgi:cobalt-zinc-cadmium resistance protein CzcA